MMTDRWYVGLTDGREVWINADEARVDSGYLVLSRRSMQGSNVALALAPGEWTTLTPQPAPIDPDLPLKIDRFCLTIDALEPRAPLSIASRGSRGRRGSLVNDRRQLTDRRQAQLAPQPGLQWNGIDRRSGGERRAC